MDQKRKGLSHPSKLAAFEGQVALQSATQTFALRIATFTAKSGSSKAEVPRSRPADARVQRGLQTEVEERDDDQDGHHGRVCKVLDEENENILCFQ